MSAETFICMTHDDPSKCHKGCSYAPDGPVAADDRIDQLRRWYIGGTAGHIPAETRAEVAELIRRIDADAKVIAELRARVAACEGDSLAGNPSKWPHVSQIDGLSRQLAELRAVVGPKMPCGCWAVEMRAMSDFTGLWSNVDAHPDWMEPTPEFNAWRESRRQV